MASGDLTGTVSSEQYLPAACFNGSTDYIDVPHAERFLGSQLSNGFTISGWINPRNLGEGNLGNIFSKDTTSSGTAGFYIRLSGTAKIQVRINGGTAADSTTGVLFKSWIHFLWTVTAAQLSNIYINGVQTGTANVDLVQPISSITTTANARIGNRAGATDATFDGCIAKLRMWNRVLTAAEIASDYGGKIVNDGLLMNYELNGNAYDSSVFANDGTESGAYYTNVPFNNILTDVKFRNLATVTDKLFVVPMFGRNSQVLVVSANRTP